MKKFRVNQADLFFNNLPCEFDGFKIAHLSDLHSYLPNGIADDVRSIYPDIIVITGDLVDHGAEDFGDVFKLLSDLSQIAPLYIVSGNHDLRNPHFDTLRVGAEAHGAKYLADKFDRLKRESAEIGIFGISDPNVFKKEKLTAALAKSFGQVPEYGGFKLLLMHRADLFPFLPRDCFDLVLSGHMHGGQICLPNGRGILSPKSSIIGIKKPFFPDYTAGLYKKGNMSMFVSRGLSNPTSLPRIFNDTELVALTLRREAANS